RRNRIEKEKNRLDTTFVKPIESHNAWLESLGTATLGDAASLATLLRRPDLTYNILVETFPPEEPLSDLEKTSVEVEVKFSGYLKRQLEDIARLKKMEESEIPQTFDYRSVKGLSIEV